MGVVWNIVSFDQWGVELGKELAGRLVPIVSDKAKSTADLDFIDRRADRDHAQARPLTFHARDRTLARDLRARARH